MSTATESQKTATEHEVLPEPNRIILYDVPWSVYVALRGADDSKRVRMSYDDGTLELMSPEYRHDKTDRRLTRLVQAVVEELDIPCACAGSTTLRRKKKKGKKKGAGKEPDTSFYIQNERLIRDQEQIDLKKVPPPDLAVEVDNTNDSIRKLPIYAALGVPEVWRFDVDAGTLWFGRLQPDGSYLPLERSECLPMLTPGRVLEGLKLCHGISESAWGRLLGAWVRESLT